MRFGEKTAVSEVPAPPRGWCREGHQAPERWRRAGPGTKLVPTKFFQVTSQIDPAVNGTYCELHMVLANHLAGQARTT